jgi:glycosyltransferase involved in cell wall biosynthesis
MSVMEYMRAALCCVTSDLPGTRALFGDPPAGVVAARPERLVAALAELLSRPERVEALGLSARARYESTFSVEAMVASTGAVYATIAGG